MMINDCYLCHSLQIISCQIDQVSNSNSMTFTIFWIKNIKTSVHVYGLEKRFKCEVKNTKKIQIDNRISNKAKYQKYPWEICKIWIQMV